MGKYIFFKEMIRIFNLYNKYLIEINTIDENNFIKCDFDKIERNNMLYIIEDIKKEEDNLKILIKYLKIKYKNFEITYTNKEISNLIKKYS